MSAHIVAAHGGSPKKVREDRLRRKLGRMGYQLMKSAAREPDNITFGGYMIIESLSTFAVAGHGDNARGGYGLDLDDVEAWVREHGHAAATKSRLLQA